ncbi:MAG: methylmalonyl-CoA mutase [Anaerolineae bacterium]
MADLRARLKEWREGVLAATVAGRPQRRTDYATASGLPLPDIFTPLDVAGLSYSRDLGFPGAAPYTRGVYPTMYRSRLWTMRQYAGYASAEETNARFRYLLDQGQTGLSVAFDLPTQIGYDPDNSLAAGEVGRVGVSIASVADMARLFEGIPLDRVSTSMTINATAPVLLAMDVATARRRGVAADDLRGTLQNDVLKEYVARGTHIFPPGPSMRLVTDVIAFSTRQMPLWNPISVSGYHIREAGATAVQEVAFTLANALEYAAAAGERGLDPDSFLPRLSFFFAAQSDILEEVAKFRAARRLWGRLVADRFAPADPRSRALRFHTQTAGATLTAQQPANNVVRVALQALAAVLGGTQSLHTNSMDEALGLPTRESATLALRTQQILAEESGLAAVVDPLAGSYALEALTDRVEAEAAGLMAKIDELGGARRAVESGWVAAQVADSAYELQRSLESGDRRVVGVNVFEAEGAASPRPLAIDPEVEARRAAEVARLRRDRDGEAAARCLARLGQEARGDDNLMPVILEAVEAYATVGEICDVLRASFGEYRAPAGV